MRAEWFTFKPTFKIWLATNHKPEIHGTDDGIWRRIRLIPFNVSFKGRGDPTLEDKLRAELAGILGWAVSGAADWYRNGGGKQQGLGRSETVENATSEYRGDSDVLAQFFVDEVVQLPQARVAMGAPLRQVQELVRPERLSAAQLDEVWASHV